MPMRRRRRSTRRLIFPLLVACLSGDAARAQTPAPLTPQ